MIRAFVTQKNGRALHVLGLSERNLELLREGRPLMLALDEFDPGGPAIDVCVMHGETEGAILRAFTDRGVEVGEIIDDRCTCGVEETPESRERYGAGLHSPDCPVGKREREEAARA